MSTGFQGIAGFQTAFARDSWILNGLQGFNGLQAVSLGDVGSQTGLQGFVGLRMAFWWIRILGLFRMSFLKKEKKKLIDTGL